MANLSSWPSRRAYRLRTWASGGLRPLPSPRHEIARLPNPSGTLPCPSLLASLPFHGISPSQKSKSVPATCICFGGDAQESDTEPRVHEPQHSRTPSGFFKWHFRCTGTSAGLSSAQLSHPLTGRAWPSTSQNSLGSLILAFPLSIRNALSGFLQKHWTSPLSSGGETVLHLDVITHPAVVGGRVGWAVSRDEKEKDNQGCRRVCLSMPRTSVRNTREDASKIQL